MPVFRFIFVWSFFFCFLYLFLCFSFRVPALLGCGSSYFLSVLHPPCAACEPACLRVPFVCCLLVFLISFLILSFFSSVPFFYFDFDVVCLILSSSFGYFYLCCRFGFGACCVCSSHQTRLSTRRHRAHPVSVPIVPRREIQESSVVTNPRHRDITV